MAYVAKVFIKLWLKGRKTSEILSVFWNAGVDVIYFSNPHLMCVFVCVARSSTDPSSFGVQVFPHCRQQLAQTLQRQPVLVLNEFDQAAVYDGLRDHLQLKKFSDKPHGSQRMLAGFVFGLLQLQLQLLTLGFLGEQTEASLK